MAEHPPSISPAAAQSKLLPGRLSHPYSPFPVRTDDSAMVSGLGHSQVVTGVTKAKIRGERGDCRGKNQHPKTVDLRYPGLSTHDLISNAGRLRKYWSTDRKAGAAPPSARCLRSGTRTHSAGRRYNAPRLAPS